MLKITPLQPPRNLNWKFTFQRKETYCVVGGRPEGVGGQGLSKRPYIKLAIVAAAQGESYNRHLLHTGDQE